MEKTATLDASELVQEAIRLAGPSNFGEPAIQPALQLLVDAINTEAGLTPEGVYARKLSLLRLLSNRLKLTNFIRSRPYINETEIGAPLIIVGLPRSGTTKMQRALAADSRFNHIKLYECMFPVPLSDADDDRNSRREMTQQFCHAAKSGSPDFYAAHPMDAEEAEEEMVLMQHSLMNDSFDAELRIPKYIEWLNSQDSRPMYKQLATFLRVLADQNRSQQAPWLLKGTYHGPHLENLLSIFPKARFIHCHRNPNETVASYLSLVSNVRSLTAAYVDRKALGEEALAYWSRNASQTVRARNQIPEETVLDVPYHSIVHEFDAVVQRVYKFIEMELTDQAHHSIKSWNANNGQHKHGSHSYSLQDFDIKQPMIDEAFIEYKERFKSFIDI